MHDNFLGFWNKIDKNCQKFIYSWKVSKIQHVICPYNERNFFTFHLILINSPTDGITLQLFSIRWTTTDFEILRNMNNYRKLLFSCTWNPHLLFLPHAFLLPKFLKHQSEEKKALYNTAIISVPLTDNSNELWQCHVLIIPFINWKDNLSKEVSACCKQPSRQTLDG